MTNHSDNISPESFDHLVYLRIFEGCNLHCEHCFIPSNPKKMTLEQIRLLPENVSNFAKRGETILLQWHGGEPTALGADFVSQSIRSIEEAGSDYRWIHGIQTNLMNYNSEWRDIFKNHFDNSVGVSWDPEIRLLRRGRPDTNRQYEERFWENFEKLVDDGINPYLIITGTKVFFERFRNPFSLYEFLESKNVSHMHIERLTKTGYARESWGKIGVSNLEYSQYMARLAKAYFLLKSRPRKGPLNLHVSPFDGLMGSVERLHRGETGGYGCLSGACDTKFHTYDANGYKPGCTAINSEIDNKSAGVEIINFVDLTSEREERQQSCTGCRYLPICSSGCMATTKIDYSGECSGGKTLFKEIEHIVQQ